MDFVTSDWNGFECLDFVLNDRNAKVVLPHSRTADTKWLLKTEYFNAFPAFEIEMLHRGYGVAYIENSTRWHRDSDDFAKEELCRFLEAEFHFCSRCMPVGMSCGGMHAVYFAARFPHRVAALYLDAPVLNLLSCPCGVGCATDELYGEFYEHMGKTVSQLINDRHQPIDAVPTLIEHRIPVFLVCGDSDHVVPYCENGIALAQLYENSSVDFEQRLKKGCDHHPHGLTDCTPLIDFTLRHY